MTAELAVIPTSQAMAERPSSGLALSFAEMTMRVRQLDQFYREVMQEGTDYGKIPGTDKPTLYQPGAQLLDQIFGYVPTFEVTPSSVIDWDRPIPFFHYIVRCRLISGLNGKTVAEGIGSCNSHEDRYRWRNAKPACPECGKDLFRSKNAPEWYCWRKQGGCGFTTPLDKVGPVGKTENEDSASLENTISKMAQKRAHIAATLNATGASRIFTQDVEDLPQFQQATVVQSSSRPVEPEDAPFGPEDVGPTASTSSAEMTVRPTVADAPVVSEPRKSTPARPVQKQPEPAAKEVARARAMQETPLKGTSRVQLIAQVAQNVRAVNAAGGELRMPTGEQLKGLTDADLQKMVTDTAAALAAAQQTQE